MPKAQVIELLGQPDQVITLAGGGQKLIWQHSAGPMFGVSLVARGDGADPGPKAVLDERRDNGIVWITGYTSKKPLGMSAKSAVKDGSIRTRMSTQNLETLGSWSVTEPQ